MRAKPRPGRAQSTLSESSQLWGCNITAPLSREAPRALHTVGGWPSGVSCAGGHEAGLAPPPQEKRRAGGVYAEQTKGVSSARLCRDPERPHWGCGLASGRFSSWGSQNTTPEDCWLPSIPGPASDLGDLTSCDPWTQALVLLIVGPVMC